MNKTSVESSAQDDDLQVVKRRKRHIPNDTSETAKKSTNSIPTILEEEADKAARDLTAPAASAHRLATSKITLSDINKDIPGVENLLKHKRRLRKLWQETRDAACKTVLIWVAETIRRITRTKALK
jgi:hypothetical protein